MTWFFRKAFKLINKRIISYNCALTVLVWMPKDPENKYGHVSILTNKYYISYWPNGNVKYLGSFKTITDGVQASLVFNHNYDYWLENKRKPLEYKIDSVSDEKVNQIYEEILEYNGIDKNMVTIEKGEEIVRKFEAKRSTNQPEISLERSLYSLHGTNFYDADEKQIREFYKNKQSCTTFTLGLLLNAKNVDPTYHFRIILLQITFAAAMILALSYGSNETGLKLVGDVCKYMDSINKGFLSVEALKSILDENYL